MLERTRSSCAVLRVGDGRPGGIADLVAADFVDHHFRRICRRALRASRAFTQFIPLSSAISGRD